MIVPSGRLLFLTACAVGFVTTLSGSASLLIAVAAVFLVFGAIDALAGRTRADAIHASLPSVIRLTRNREGVIPVLVQTTHSRLRILRIALPLPSIFGGRSDLWIELPPGSKHSRAEFPCLPTKRGRYSIKNIYLDTPSLFHLWTVRRKLKADAEIRVYPNLIEDRKKTAALFLNRGEFGIHSRRIVGQGREFEKLREYNQGDPFDQIFWKATARRGKPITKLYQVERTQEVYVVIDFSRLSNRKTGEETNLEFSIRSALLLGLIAQKQGDLFGLLSFSDRIGAFIRAGNGKAHYHSCRDAIYSLQPRLANPDYRELFSFIRQRIRRRSLLVILTDLSDPLLAEQFAGAADLIARQHLVLVNMMRPPLAVPLFSHDDAHSTDDLYRKLSGHLLWQTLRDLENNLHLHGIKMTQLDHASFTASIVSQYLNVKHRQVL